MLFPKTVLLSSGGVLVLSHVGALKALHERKLLKYVKSWGGVSGGALLATCICLGYTMKEIQDICERFDFQVLQNIDENCPFRFLETFGLDSGENLDKFVKALFRVHGWSPDITFSELAAKTSLTLQIWAADIDTGTLKEFSAAKTPEYPVAGALRASMLIPVLYPPLQDKDTNNLLVDGALIHSMPLCVLDKDILNDTLGILCHSQPPQPAPRDVIGYLKHLVTVGIDSRTQLILSKYGERVINITLPSNFSGTTFNLSIEQKVELINIGYDAANKWILKVQLPTRRYSI
jgi:predicted acylesterase/phospholipase RssA